MIGSQTRDMAKSPGLVQKLKGAYFWSASSSLTVFFCLWAAIVNAVATLLRRPKDGRWVHPIAARWGRTVFNLTPGWRIQLEGLENLPKTEEPMVIVANHQSMTDIFIMYFIPLQFRWLSKEEVFKIPFMGLVMRWSAYVPVRRGHQESHTAAMRISEQRIDQGLSMLYFPEGTRSEDGRIKEFKHGAFRLAREKQVRVLPVALNGASALMPKGSKIPQDALVRIKILAPMPPPPLDQDLEAYVAQARQLIVAAQTKLV